MPAKPAARRAAAPAAPAGPASFKELLHQFGTDRGRAIVAMRAIVRLPETTAHTLTKRGAMMDPAASERLWRLADLMHLASTVFDDADPAKAWLRAPN